MAEPPQPKIWKLRVEDDLGFRFDQHQAQRIAALDGTDVTNTVGFFERAGVARVEEMFANLVEYSHMIYALRPRTKRPQEHWALALGLSNLKPVWVSVSTKIDGDVISIIGMVIGQPAA